MTKRAVWTRTRWNTRSAEEGEWFLGCLNEGGKIRAFSDGGWQNLGDFGTDPRYRNTTVEKAFRTTPLNHNPAARDKHVSSTT